MLLSLCQKHNLHIPDDELAGYVSSEEDAVIAKLKEGLEPCEGVHDALKEMSRKYDLAVVSSSALRRVNASLVKTNMQNYFGDKVFSAATSLPKPTSKPDPAIYNFAVEKLGKKSDECVAVEDSKSGTLSAVRAGIAVVGYVGSYDEDEQAKMKALLKENGASVIIHHWSEFDGAMQAIEKAGL
jgi:HAD superfamily hydrolase (TIGR01509 family)